MQSMINCILHMDVDPTKAKMEDLAADLRL